MSKRKFAATFMGETDGPSSQGTKIGPPQSTGKRRRGKAEEEGPRQEARLARVRNACPKNIAERVHRVMTQRFYMVDRQREGSELCEEFQVLGSTGNVYTVVIDRVPSCNCPDAQKGNHCKHILFVFLKVLSVSQESGYYYQKALLTSELSEIFASAPKNPTTVTSARIGELYAAATGKASSSVEKGSEGDTSLPKKQLGEDDDCPICYEGMKDSPPPDLEFCTVCANAVHKQCFGQWRAMKKGEELTCVWCRSPWVDQAGSSKGAKAEFSGEGYLNLGAAAGISSHRDDSTYYGGPRRGRPYYRYY